jgi:aryl-alcohol dehydrogenase-like predicted oxidoreductase
MQALDEAASGPFAEVWNRWRARYVPALQKLLSAIRHEATLTTRDSIQTLREALEPVLPDARKGAPTNHVALWATRSAPGVTSVLLGMRRESYVEDAVEVMRWPPLAHPRASFEAAQTVKHRLLDGPLAG